MFTWYLWSEWPSSKSLQTVISGKGVENSEHSCSVCGNVNWDSHYGRWYLRFLKILGIKPPYELSITLLGIYPEETKIERDTWIPFFIAVQFTIARTWKQPRCSLTDEWIKKLWFMYTIEHYIAIKRNIVESVLMRWINLESIMQSEVSQKEKDKYCVLTHIYRI